MSRGKKWKELVGIDINEKALKFEEINTNKFNKGTLKYIDYRDYQE